MQRGGWSNDGVLKGVYRHTMGQEIEPMTNIVNEHFSNIMQHEMQHEK